MPAGLSVVSQKQDTQKETGHINILDYEWTLFFYS